MASVEPSGLGGRHQLEFGRPRFWWFRALNASQRNWKYLLSVMRNSLVSDVSTYQNPGERKFASLEPMVGNSQARGSVLEDPLGSIPKGGSKAARLIHWFI